MAKKAKKKRNDDTQTYRIECGNSGTGAVGAVAYVEASSALAAREKLFEFVPNEGEEIRFDQDVVVLVYFGRNKWGQPEECD